MAAKPEMTKILMVGPDISGPGGISKVIRTWVDNGFFSGFDLFYHTSIKRVKGRGVFTLFKDLILFLTRLNSGGAKVVYVHTSSRTSFYRKSLFLIPALIFKTKTVLHIHPSHFYDFLMSLEGIRKRGVFAILRRVTALVVLTDEMQVSMCAVTGNKPVFVLRNPVDVQSFQVDCREKRQDNRLIYLGWFIPEKGVFDLVDAMAMLLESGFDARLEFYGIRGAQKLKQHVKATGVEENVNVNGWVDDQGKMVALRKSAALILPSYSEGLPNVILEAMASQTPILATAVGGMKEILVDGENAVIVKKADPQDLSQKIKLLIEQPELRAKLAENAYREVCEKYDTPVIKNNLRKILRQLS